MPIRKTFLANGEVYHICTKSIAGYQVFKSSADYKRCLEALCYYRIKNPPEKFSRFLKLKQKKHNSLIINPEDGKSIVKIIAYCLMPTHIHLVLQQIEENGISDYMGNILKSYSLYFNSMNNRKGPLWENRFRNVLVKTDEQLLHLTRYLHLNPVTAYLVEKPEYWEYSSCHEYLGNTTQTRICEFEEFIEIKQDEYKEFMNSRIDEQRDSARIKSLILD